MSNKTIEERVIEVIADQLGFEPSEVSPTSNLIEDLQADSLDEVECTMAIEEEFNIEITDDEYTHFKIVQGIVDLVKSKLP